MSGLLRGGGAHRRARRVSFIRGLRLPQVVNGKVSVGVAVGRVGSYFWGSRGVRQKSVPGQPSLSPGCGFVTGDGNR